jgi:hypothetical protein
MEASMNTLEIPFRPGWPIAGEPRIDPPLVHLEPRWEYKTITREVATGLLSEAELNAVGSEHWELTGIVPAGTQVCFYFKRVRAS